VSLKQDEEGRLVVLDGMRGVAAFAVMLHHALAAWRTPFTTAYMAVDFFFILSGYVIASAYERRLRHGLRLGPFCWVRLRRLLPTMWLGVIMGSAAAVFVDHAGYEVIPKCLAALLFIPTDYDAKSVFPLNGVQWSLLFELLANAFHALVFWRLGNRALGIIAGFSLLALAAGSWPFGTLDVGYSLGTLYLALARVGFGYCVGILLFRVGGASPVLRVPALLPPLCFIGLLAFMSIVGRWWAEMLGLILMPLLILAGASATTRATELYEYFGRVSYPIYAIHLPILVVVGFLPFDQRMLALLAVTIAVATTVDPAGRLLRATVKSARSRPLSPDAPAFVS